MRLYFGLNFQENFAKLRKKQRYLKFLGQIIMRPSILLLDCSSALAQKLKRQGFDVNSGTIGFCTGTRHLPCQVYEREIIIYNPSSFARKENGYITASDIQDVTPEYSLTPLSNHIFFRGATLLVFINRVADDLARQNEAYSWIPFMPGIQFTKDHQTIAAEIPRDYHFLAPVVVQNDLKIPVLQKINLPELSKRIYLEAVVPLFSIEITMFWEFF